MSQTHFLFVLSALVGALYFAKNIKINITGAEALPQVARVAELMTTRPSQSKSLIETSTNESNSRQINSQIDSEQNEELNILVEMIHDQKLCEFLDFVNSNNISTVDQYKALTMSFAEPGIDELEVFVNPNIDQLENFKSEAARAFIVATDQGAFESVQNLKIKDFAKGLSEKHQDFLLLYERFFSQFKKNLFYPLLKNNIYAQYKNLPESKRQEIFDRVMATTHYMNPVFEMVRSLYLQSRNNVAQFYLATEIFKKSSFTVDRLYIQRSIWAVYAPEMRDHYADLLLENLEKNQDSSQSFGYEPDVYFAYRNSVPYSLYESLPDPGDYDKIRIQPVYDLKDLTLDLSQGCTSEKVQELAIKLRSL